MASDVEDLTTFYANLPSIFENDPSTSIQRSFDTPATISHSEKTYQPMFGSFLFADSELFTKAAFAPSTSSSIEVETTQEQLTSDGSALIMENNTSTDSNILATTLPPLAPVEDISDTDDEDDFDGIPIRHASTMIKNNINGDSDLIVNHVKHNNILDESVHHVENDRQNNNVNHINHEEEEDDDDDDSFLNGFTDEEQHGTITRPFLFKDIPDIDDLNEHEEDDDDKIPFDHMDMLDQSDSIRSSSPDSLLSSSHLRDEHDDDDEEEEMNHNDDDDVTQWNDDFILGKSNIQDDRPNAPLPPQLLLNMHSHDQVDFIDLSRSNSRCSNASSDLSNGYADQAQIFINDDELVISSDSDGDDDDDAHDDRINFEDPILDRDNSEEPSLQVNLDYNRSRTSTSSSFNKSNSIHSSSPIPDETPIVAIDENIDELKPIQIAPIAIVDDDDDDDLPIFSSDQPVLPPIPLKTFIGFQSETRQNEIAHEIINIRHMFNEHDNDDDFLAIMHNPSMFEEAIYDIDDQQKSDFDKQANADTSRTSSQLSIENKIESESSALYQNIQQSSVSDNKENSNSPSSFPSYTTTTNKRSLTAVNHLTIEKDEDDDDASSIRQEAEQHQSKKKNTTNIDIKQITNGEEQQMMSSDDESDNDSDLLNTLAQLHGLVHTPRISDEINQNINETEIFNQNIHQDENKNSNSIHNLLSTFDIDEKKEEINFHDKKKYDEQKTSPGFSSTSSILFNDDKSYSPDSNTSSSLIMSTNELNDSYLSSNQFIPDDLSKQSMSHIVSSNTEKDKNDLTNYLYWIIKHLDDDLQTSTIIHEQNNKDLFSLNAEKLVSNTLQLALSEVNELDQQVEQFVDQILSEAIYEVYNEDNTISESKLDENLLTENLPSIINWHNQTNESLLDPFDSIWTSHFQASNENDIDPWLTQSTVSHPISFHSNTFNQPNDSQETVLSPLLTNPFDSSITADDLIRSSLTESVTNDCIDDSSISPDYLTIKKNKSIETPDQKVNEEESTELKDEALTTDALSTAAEVNDSDTSESEHEVEIKPQHNVFTSTSRLSQFEAFGSDRPLNIQGIDSIAAAIDNEFNQSSQIQESTDDNAPWASTEQTTKSSDADDEPWELNDSGEEAKTTISAQRNDSSNNFFPNTQSSSPWLPAITKKSDDENNNEDSEEQNYDDYFSKQQQQEPPEDDEDIEPPSLSKSVRFDENINNVTVLTPKDSLERSESISTSDSDDIDDEDTTPSFKTVSDRITDHINQDYKSDDDTAEVSIRNITPYPDSHISLTESEDLPPPLPPLPPMNKKSNTSSDNIPLKTALSSNIDLKLLQIHN